MRRTNLISTLATVALFIFLEVISIVMISRNSIIQRYKVVGAVRSVQTSFWRTGQKISYFFDYRRENERLAAENLALRQELDGFRRYYEGSQFDSIVPMSGFRYVSASVVKNSTNRQHNYLLLDKGAVDGIAEGMGVVTASGIVGIVNAVSDHYSYVISFLSKGQTISAKIAANNIFGPMTWTGRAPDKAHVSEIPAHTEVAVGDTITSSGYSTIYPPDIPLGVVTATSNDGVSLDLSVDMFQNFKSLRHVYIVSNIHSDELKQLTDER